VLALVNIRGVEPGARVMRILTVLKLGALATIAMWAVLFGLGNWANFMPFVSRRPGSEPFAAAFATALVGAFFAFGGWWDASKLTGEVRDPERTLPRALALGVVAVTFVYITTSAVFIYLVPMERVTSGETFAAQAGEALFGRSGGIVFSLVVIVSILGSLASLMLAAPRVYYAMARDGIFFTWIAGLHPKFGTPWLAITLQAVMAALLALSGSFGQIVAYFVFVTVIFIALTVAAVFRLHRRMLPATVFLALVSLLLVLVGSNNPKQALLGMAVVALGAPVYYIFKKKEYQP
jgi:APA family basic amino acid/polyamine antiporter